MTSLDDKQPQELSEEEREAGQNEMNSSSKDYIEGVNKAMISLAWHETERIEPHVDRCSKGEERSPKKRRFPFLRFFLLLAVSGLCALALYMMVW